MIKSMNLLNNSSDGCDKAFIFHSEDNPPGVNWLEIETCDSFVAIITQKYLDSDICYYEFNAAFVTHKKPIIPQSSLRIVNLKGSVLFVYNFWSVQDKSVMPFH